jgi:hypothetical protein
MGMKTTALIIFLIASVAQAASAADSVQVQENDFCKVSYTDQDDGDAGTYLGECLKETPNGRGEVSYYNGDSLQGDFKNGIVDGAGTYRSSGGNRYEGGFQEGKRHGKGVYTWAQGSTYSGQWTDDERHGSGVFTWSNGNRFEGEFRNNKRYNGTYITGSGRVYKCRLGQCR